MVKRNLLNHDVQVPKVSNNLIVEIIKKVEEKYNMKIISNKEYKRIEKKLYTTS